MEGRTGCGAPLGGAQTNDESRDDPHCCDHIDKSMTSPDTSYHIITSINVFHIKNIFLIQKVYNFSEHLGRIHMWI